MEPSQSDTPGFFLISIVAIQGIGSTSSTPATSAHICLPTAPGPWIPIGNWSCSGGGSNQIQVAAAYRFTQSGTDAPGNQFTWSFSSTDCTSPTPETYIASVTNTLYSNISMSDTIDVVGTPTCTNNSTGGAVVAAAITTNVPNELVVGIFDAAGAGQSLGLPGTGSDLGPVVSESNTNQGPANFTAFANTLDIGMNPPCNGFDNGECGAVGSYGPFTAVQGAPGEGLGLAIGLNPGI